MLEVPVLSDAALVGRDDSLPSAGAAPPSPPLRSPLRAYQIGAIQQIEQALSAPLGN